MAKPKGPEIPQIYDALIAVEAMDKEKKDTPEYKSAHNRAIKEIKKYNEFHKKFGTSIAKVREILRFRHKRLNEEKKQKELEQQFKEAQKARFYKDNQDRGKKK